MVKWFGRYNEIQQEATAIPEQVEAQPVDPHAFIAAQEPRLVASADAWRVIAQKSKEREEGYTEHIRQGLIDVWVANRSAPLPEVRILDRETEKLATDLSVYSLLAARHFSALGIKWGLQDQIKEHFLHIPDHTVNYIIRSKGFPTRRFLIRQVNMAQEMASADDTAQAVLVDLTRTYQDRPDDIAALAGLYENGADEADGRFAELKEIVATDWHRPDPEQSILRQFCGNLREAPRAYVAEYVNMVSANEGDRRWSTVRNMARFAIIATGGNPNDQAAIETMLQGTYARWGEVPDIDGPFRSFVQGKVDALIGQFTVIAGSKAAKNIRAYPNAEQVASFKDYFAAHHTPDRASRRKVARAAIKSHRADLLPTADSIDRVATVESIRDKSPKRIMAVTNTERGLNIVDSSIDGVLEKFKINNDGSLAEDVRKMMTWLQLNPISPASERLARDAGIRMSYAGKPVKLWRFAPNRVPEVSVQSDNRYWRIVYGLVKDGLIVVDILDHDAFDKKYK